MQNSTQFQEDVKPRTLLQVRVFHRDETGVVRDETQETHRKARGLAYLQDGGHKAVRGLFRTRELLQLLALAAEEREDISVSLVQRVLDEIEDELNDTGDLGWYVQSMEKFFQQAEALPAESRAEHETPDQSVAPVPCEA
ncbi:MAG: hypothetical protein U0223_03900 [Nitrospira sp.]|nr:hypothetical protein [Nitrospira sp.]